MKISVIGIDLSKNIFHLVGINHRGEVVKRKKAGRGTLVKRVQELSSDALVCMEACQSAHFWCRELGKAGYTARQIPAQHVKAYLQRQKNDFNDARAIAEAGSRADTKLVPVKSAEMQELDAIRSVRRRLGTNHTALMNQVRGLLAEQGIVFARGRRALGEYLCSDMAGIGATLRQVLREAYRELLDLEDRMQVFDKILEQRASECPVIKRLKTIPGVGTKTAVALSTLSGDPREFKNGRDFAANLGLVPRQCSTGGKTKLLGISKKGDRERRSLLVIGAQSALRVAVHKKREDPHSLWIRKLHEKKGKNLTAVALANKNARIAWCILTTPGLTYSEQLCH